MSNFWFFSIVPELIWDAQSKSEVSFLVSYSPELLKVKLKTPPGPPTICTTNERSHQAEQLCCWNRQLKMYHFVRNWRWSWSHTQNVWESYGKMFWVIIFNLISPYDSNLTYIKVVELEKHYLVVKCHFYIHKLDFEKINSKKCI